ncbi:hypothetical protein H0E87_010279 [Populus deltoides]|uniref:Serine acetyltransferase N-terminal domain-containing protein n=1 Tax=Populus deltoides TaxID=3696 RepID=A0A8T2YSD8_POPDE|nr:hypothetical protein H0E87_010279 [Populus deltoides]
MACLSDESWVSSMLSKRLSIQEGKEDGVKEEETTNSFASDSTNFPFEKVFPVYAMGFLKPESDPVLFPADSRDPIWDAVREEAKIEAEKEPILSSFLYASILSHDCLEQALAFVLANRLQNPTLLATQLLDTISNVIMKDRGIQHSIRLDMQAFKDRDPACLSYCSALLYLKGYHSLQSYRVAHVLWNQGRTVLALALQSRISEVFGIDIHPGMFIYLFIACSMSLYSIIPCYLILEKSGREILLKREIYFCLKLSRKHVSIFRQYINVPFLQKQLLINHTS